LTTFIFRTFLFFFLFFLLFLSFFFGGKVAQARERTAREEEEEEEEERGWARAAAAGGGRARFCPRDAGRRGKNEIRRYTVLVRRCTTCKNTQGHPRLPRSSLSYL
jgi:ribosomal protein L44E